ncbi:MAG: hypothetical protein QE272_07390 [Nevskia sp.]|nr:hypothetical protein [Nevskia sp.]
MFTKLNASTIANVIAIVAAVFTVWSYFADRDKQVSFSVVSSTSLVQPLGKIAGLELLFNGSKLVDPALSTFELRNAGSVPINPTDFEREISIQVLEPAKVIDVKVSKTFPLSLNPSMSYDDRSISIKPLLLNPSDALQLSVITTGGQPKVNISARIAGISDVKLIDVLSPKNRSNVGRLLGLVALIASLMLSYLLGWYLAGASKFSGLGKNPALHESLATLLLGVLSAAFITLTALYYRELAPDNFVGGAWLVVIPMSALLVGYVGTISFDFSFHNFRKLLIEKLKSA